MGFKEFPLRSLILLLIALSCPISVAAAPVPRETIDRLAQIAVEKAETQHLNSIGKLTDPERRIRHKDLDTEAATLSKPLQLMLRHTPEEAAEINAATTTITGLTRAKLSLLEPKWRKEEAAYREAQGNRRQETMRDADRSAKQAAQIQKQRLGLQAQLDKGTLDQATFDQKDKEALAAIEALRNKNDPQGRPGYYFDERLTYYTSLPEKAPTPAVVKKPPPPAVVYRPPPEPPAGYSSWYWIGGGLFGTLSAMSWGEIAVWVIGIWLFLGFIVAVFFPDKQQAPPKPKTSGIHGTADWAAYEKTPTTHTNVSGGVTFGKSSLPELDSNARGAPITSRPETHVLITATSGAGKGTRVIIPTLLRYSSSMIVIDPKGENAAVTARARKKLGQDIQILNPWGVMKDHYSKLGFQTATFNPLDVLDRDDPNVSTLARTLAETMCPITDGKDSFWQGSAAKLLGGIFLWVTDNPVEQKTLARVKEIVSLQKPDFRKVLAQMLACDSFQGAIKQAVGQAGDISAADTYGGIMFNLQKYMDFVDGPVKLSTATSTIAMNKLADGSLTLYVVIPFDLMQTHSAWLRLVISSAIRALVKSRESAAGKALHRCMFMIDEFGSIGHIPDIVSQLAQTRSYGLDFTLILQDLNQLKDHYGKAERSILGNCRYKYFCDVIDLESAKWLSEALGKKTVQTVGTSTSQGTNKGGETEGSSTTYGETGRALLTPDEIMHLGKDTAILLNPDTRPHYLHPVDYRQLTQTYSHLKNSHPHLYWRPPLGYDENPAYSAPENPFKNMQFPPGFLENFPPMKWEKPKGK